MDCRTALDILEVARPRPDSGDLSDPELAEAAAHIESHADCRDEFLRRQQLDREIGAAMRDVPVPHDLKARLLADLAECPTLPDTAAAVGTVAVAAPLVESTPLVELKTAAESKTALRRRAWVRLVVGTAAGVAAGVIGWQFLPTGAEPIDIEGLPNQVAKSVVDEGLDFESLAAFGGDYATELPVDWTPPPKGLTLTDVEPKSYPYRQAGRPDLPVAMHQFRFRHRGAAVTGYLLVLPANRVKQPPVNRSLSPAATGMVTSQSWTDGKFVYICVVPGGHGHFRELVRLLHHPTA